MEMENDNSFTQQTARPKYDCLLFGKLCNQYTVQKNSTLCILLYNNLYYFSDLDDTLYPLNSGLALATHQNIKGK